MKITWLGQAGLFLETKGVKMMIDPYLSNGVGKWNAKKQRHIPAEECFLEEEITILVITHTHIDHMDPETIEILLKENRRVTVLAPYDAWQELRKYGRNHNYVMFNQGTSWTQDGVVLTAVMAEHSDRTAIGVLVEDGSETVYVTGDTLYNKNIFKDLPSVIDAVFLPINGAGNNMNVIDAKRFAKETGAKKAVPVHWGMFDEIAPETFDVDNAVIPQIYEEVRLT